MCHIRFRMSKRLRNRWMKRSGNWMFGLRYTLDIRERHRYQLRIVSSRPELNISQPPITNFKESTRSIPPMRGDISNECIQIIRCQLPSPSICSMQIDAYSHSVDRLSPHNKCSFRVSTQRTMLSVRLILWSIEQMYICLWRVLCARTHRYINLFLIWIEIQNA